MIMYTSRLQKNFVACLWASIAFAACTSPSQADEYRLYRIVGSELELYRRVDYEPETSNDEQVVSETPSLRELGLFDIRPEDLADESRRPQSRGDGLLWDAPRSRWVGLLSEVSGTLISLPQSGEDAAALTLHEFEIDAETGISIWATSDANVFFVLQESWNGDWLPKVTRMQFGENGQIASIETWDMADRDPERMRAAYGKPRAQHEYEDPFMATVSRGGHILTVVRNISMWDFNTLPPRHVLQRPDESRSYLQCAVSPDDALVAAVSAGDGCHLDLWRIDEERPFQSFPLQEHDWLCGGFVSFTSDGEYLWYNSMFAGTLRVWRCSDWVELDAFQFEELAMPISSNAAEWVIARRDAPFEAEPTEWYEHGPYVPLPPSPGPDFSPEALTKAVIIGLLTSWLPRADDEDRHEERD
jgi:hypothetical protein